MSGEHDTPNGYGLRRVGARDRKVKLDAGKLTFPPPESAPPSPEPTETQPQEAAPVPDTEVVSAEPPEQFDFPMPDEPADAAPSVAVPLPRASAVPPPAPLRPKRKRPSRASRILYNLLALLFFLGGCGVIGVVVALWQNPFSALNPRPPLTQPPLIVSMTPTITATLTPSLTPIPSNTPTRTPAPTNTETPAPTALPPTAPPAFPFSAQDVQARPFFYIANPEARGGCAWASVAGTVADVNGSALNDYQVRVLGNGVDETLVSGSAPGYGPGGFELQLGTSALDATFAVQLLDPGGAVASDVYQVSTSSRCDWNIVVIRFVGN